MLLNIVCKYRVFPSLFREQRHNQKACARLKKRKLLWDRKNDYKC